MHNDLNVRKAKIEDMERVFFLYSDCIRHMESEKLIQWDDSYPDRKLLTSDMEAGTLYIVHDVDDDRKVVGAVVMDECQHPEYQNVRWKHDKGKIVIFHRIAVHPDAQGKGLARRFLDIMDDKARGLGYDIARLDTYSANKRVIKFIEAHGFKKAGKVHLDARQDPYFCYEKKL